MFDWVLNTSPERYPENNSCSKLTVKMVEYLKLFIVRTEASHSFLLTLCCYSVFVFRVSYRLLFAF